jgi:small subunit ribosomal protein S2
MSKIPTLEELFKAGVHFGHKTSKWHPKMNPFIFTSKNKLHIVDLEETRKSLETAYKFVKDTVSAGGVVLFLGTKKQAQTIIKDAAVSCNMPFINVRWLGGTLTNAKSVLGLVKKYRRLKTERDLGKLDRYTKKERLMIEREIARLEPVVGGIESLSRVPEILFVIDMKKEKTAVVEANKTNVPIVALCDTNVNPSKSTLPIPGNDDAVKSIKIIVDTIVAAVKEGQANKKTVDDKVLNPKPVTEVKVNVDIPESVVEKTADEIVASKEK